MPEIIYPDKLKELAIAEHDGVSTPTKKSLVYGWDTNGLQKVRLKVNADGKLEIAPQTTLKTIRKTLSVSGEVIAGVAGQKIYLVSLTISCDAALTVEVSWGASPTDDKVIEAGYFATNGGLKADYSIYGPIISGAAENLYCTITGTGNAKITAKYYQE